MGAVLVPVPATDSALAIYAHARGIVPSATADSGPERKRDQKQVDNHRHRDGKPLVPGFLIEKYRQQACCNQCSAIERNQHKRGQNTVIVDFGMNALDRYHDHRNHEGMLLAVGGWLVINSLLRK